MILEKQKAMCYAFLTLKNRKKIKQNLLIMFQYKLLRKISGRIDAELKRRIAMDWNVSFRKTCRCIRSTVFKYKGLLELAFLNIKIY